MSSAGILSVVSQRQTKESRDAAEAGLDVIINTLNARQNRKLLVAKVPLNSWDASNPKLRNPCLASDEPTSAALNLTSNQENSIAENPRQVFVLKSITLKNPGRNASFSSASDASGPGGTAGSESGSYVDTAVELDPDATTAAGGFIELVVEGRAYDASGRLKSTSRITREFEVIPKCCGIGFSAPYGNETRSCSLPSLIIGLNGGGLKYEGIPSPSPALRLTNSVTDSGTSSTRPPTVYCVTSTSVCGGNQSSIDGISLSLLGLTPPQPPSYPPCTGSLCSSGYAINLTSTFGTAGRDYVRVNSSATGVEICNADNNNTSVVDSNLEPRFPANVPDLSCSTAINSYCVKEASASAPPVFHCRISQLTVLDSTSAGNNSSAGNRVQNNTLWIDTTRGSIYFYLNQAWLVGWPVTGLPVNLVNSNGFQDGQIQHLNCLDSSGSVPATYAGLCGQAARPRDIPKVMIYSDSNIKLSVGDDGFLRDLLVFLPKGTISLIFPDSSAAGCNPPLPSLRAMLWVDNLEYSRGAACTVTPYNATGPMQLVVPPYSAAFSNVANQKQIIYEWIARSSTFTSLF
ncbi:MAG: hypothetical protein VKI83_07930 [Synechococcaceae cyanobacterium]|nr:hypothetical protein [Synechococcaceae cyanobacterium]